jgi:hypothetical protein
VNGSAIRSERRKTKTTADDQMRIYVKRKYRTWTAMTDMNLRENRNEHFNIPPMTLEIRRSKSVLYLHQTDVTDRHFPQRPQRWLQLLVVDSRFL